MLDEDDEVVQHEQGAGQRQGGRTVEQPRAVDDGQGASPQDGQAVQGGESAREDGEVLRKTF